MKKLKLLLLSSVMMVFTACGTEIRDNKTRFDMWNYMTATIDYEVKYDIYENNVYLKYHLEEHRMIYDSYERKSGSDITTLYLNGSTILMREPSQDVTIEHYVNLGDKGIFHAPSIQMCSLERHFNTYERKGLVFHDVIMVNCMSMSGVQQEFYYGYNEGIVVIYENDGVNEKEWIKVREVRL